MSVLDARGCLTAQALASLSGAPVGQAPPEVAAHLAGCARCQDRLLRADRAPGDARRTEARAPFRNLVVVGVVLLATLLALAITLVVLSNR